MKLLWLLRLAESREGRWALNVASMLLERAVGMDFYLMYIQIVTDYTDQNVKISNYPLSAALTCAKVTSGLEEIWGII